MTNYQLYPGKERKVIEFETDGKIVPEITIITAYWNGYKYIDYTINSVLNQTFPYWEWIIVDDGSTEEKSKEKLKEIEKIDRRIKVIHKENSGLAATRDYGVEFADKNSKYLFFLDDDDLINPTYLECAYWTLQTNKEASWAYTDLVNFEGMEFEWVKWFDSEIEKKENLLVATALIRKKDFLEVNGYELREKAVNEDWNLWLKLLAKGKKPIRMNFKGFWYRKKAQGSELQRSKQNQQRALEIINQTSKKIEKNVEAIQYPKQDYNWEKIEEDCYENKKYQIKSNGKTNILMIIPWMTVGGADKFNLDLITRIDKSKYNMIIVTTEPNINIWRQEFEEQAIVYDLTTFLDRRYWIAFMNSLIHQYRIDIIFNTNSTFGYAVIPYLKSKYPEIPIMDYIHMEEWYNRCGGFSRDSSMISSCIDKTLVCNKNSARILKEYFNREEKDIETVYIGVDEKKFNPNLYDKQMVLKELGIENKENRKILSYICRIDIQKRPLLLIEILKELKKKRQDFLCIISGDGPMLVEVKEKIKKYNLMEHVITLGNIKETQKIYKISDVTINCSIKEGVALTTYESLAMGVPVVTSKVGGQGELVNEEVGITIPCMQKEKEILNFRYELKEIEKYVEAIEQVLNHLENYRGKCRNRVLNGFTIDQMVDNMEKNFEEVKKNKNVDKIQNGEALSKMRGICKEMISKYYIAMKEEYEWLCNQVNISYFGETKGNSYSSYDYFKTPMGKFRLKVIEITKKLNIYEIIKKIIKKLRRN